MRSSAVPPGSLEARGRKAHNRHHEEEKREAADAAAVEKP